MLRASTKVVRTNKHLILAATPQSLTPFARPYSSCTARCLPPASTSTTTTTSSSTGNNAANPNMSATSFSTPKAAANTATTAAATTACAGKSGAKQPLVSTPKLGEKSQDSSVDFSALEKHLVKFDNLAELQRNACMKFAKNPIFGTRVGDHFEWMTYSEFGIEVEKFKSILAAHKIGVNDKVALISNNRVEWAVVMYASVSIGAQIVPMYEAQLESDWEYILQDSDAKLLVVSTQSVYNKAVKYVNKLGKVESIIGFDLDQIDGEMHPHCYKRQMHVAAATGAGKRAEESSPLMHIPSDHLAFIIYTSGTTGVPKGVELSHGNFVADVKGAQAQMGMENLVQHKSMAFLPWAHVFGLTSELHSLISNGSALGIVPSREQILECMQLIKPSVIMSVPILFNRIYDGAQANIAKESGFKQKIIQSAFSVARKRNALLEMEKEVPFPLKMAYQIADKVVLSKIRAKIGPNLKYMASGGAAVSVPVLQFFEDIGIPITEGYGLTETAPMITVSGLELGSRRRLGCVGMPLPGFSVRIVNPRTLEELPANTDGEVTCAGGNVMVGYRNNPAANEEVFYNDEHGTRYFRTGDLGQMVDGRFLKITGRIKEQYKLENGKYVVPAPVEDILSRSAVVNQMYLFGMNKPHTVALIVPNMVEVENWVRTHVGQLSTETLSVANELKLTAAPPSTTAAPLTGSPTDLSSKLLHALAKDAHFQQYLSAELLKAGGDSVKGYERPLYVALLSEAFTQDNQMLTPKMSLRRNNIMKAYSPAIDAVYALSHPSPHIPSSPSRTPSSTSSDGVVGRKEKYTTGFRV